MTEMSAEFEFTTNLDAVLNATAEQIGRALTECGLVAEGHAKEYCPVRTGNLRNSITYETDTSENTVYIGTNVEYAPNVELGTVNQKARPYLKPGIANHTDEYEKIIKDRLTS